MKVGYLRRSYITCLRCVHRHGVPQRLAEALCGEAGVSERRVAELRKAERVELLDKLTEYPLQYDGHEGYAKVRLQSPNAEVRASFLPGCGRIP